MESFEIQKVHVHRASRIWLEELEKLLPHLQKHTQGRGKRILTTWRCSICKSCEKSKHHNTFANSPIEMYNSRRKKGGACIISS